MKKRLVGACLRQWILWSLVLILTARHLDRMTSVIITRANCVRSKIKNIVSILKEFLKYECKSSSQRRKAELQVFPNLQDYSLLWTFPLAFKYHSLKQVLCISSKLQKVHRANHMQHILLISILTTNSHQKMPVVWG